jgi:calcineurin-like phosphoesterase family protein
MKKRTWEDVVRCLPGKKSLILGNHDNDDPEYYEFLGFKVLQPFTARMGVNRIHFSHDPMMVKGDWDINIHGHLHNNDHRELPNGEEVDWRRNVSIELTNYRPIHIGDAI